MGWTGPDAGARSVASVCAVVAGAIHAVAAGLHAEDPGSARAFLLLAAVQVT